MKKRPEPSDTEKRRRRLLRRIAALPDRGVLSLAELSLEGIEALDLSSARDLRRLRMAEAAAFAAQQTSGIWRTMPLEAPAMMIKYGVSADQLSKTATQKDDIATPAKPGTSPCPKCMAPVKLGADHDCPKSN